MKRIRLDSSNLTAAIPEAVDLVRSGGILVYPTDTVYGLGCDPFSLSALRRLTSIKQRSDSQQYVVLERDPPAAKKWIASIPEHFDFFARELWPGPVTMIFSKHRSSGPLEGSDSIALRVPEFDFLRQLLSSAQIPLVSTSANRSGLTPLRDPELIWREFGSDVDLFLDCGTLSDRLPSSILDMRLDPPQLLRRGANVEEVEIAIGKWVRGRV